MILVDTSIWIDHLRRGDARLTRLLSAGQVVSHPWVVGELVLGGLASAQRAHLHKMRQATVASDAELLALIDGQELAGSGIGWVDVGLLASVRMSPFTRLWTRDHRLDVVAERLEVAYRP